MRLVVHLLGELCVTAGALLLLFLGWQLWWTDLLAGQVQRETVVALRQQWADGTDGSGGAAAPGPAGAAPAPADPPVAPPPEAGRAFAVVHVPRFGADYEVAVEEGTGLAAVLDDGLLGHYPGTAMPGAVGNFSVAGHRVSHGSPLRDVEALGDGDAVVVETAQAWYVYRVRSRDVVAPDRVEVVAAVPGQPDAAPTERLMTLTTCHPMYTARERYVVTAVLERWQPLDAGEPAALAG